MSDKSTDGVQRAVLSNGLTVLIKENHASPVAAVVANVAAGYFDEPDRWGGISHVVEHMVFKGTDRRPGKERIAEEVKALGGSLNAGTYYEDTNYHITVPCQNISKAIAIQADMLRNPRVDDDELAKELEVIIQESKQKRDNASAMLIETLYALAFDHHRIRRWRIGEEETLRSFRRENVLEFMRQSYVPGNIVVSVCGDFDVQTALGAVEKSWADMTGAPIDKEPSPLEPEGGEFRYHRMTGDIEQKLLVFGFRAPGLLTPEAPALVALDTLLSDGRSSRLYQSVKEEQRLASSVWADYEGFRDFGVFTVGAEVPNDDPLEAQSALMAEVTKLADGSISRQELTRVKTRVESRRMFAQEEVLGQARTFAWYETRGSYLLFDEFIEGLHGVTAADVSAAASKYLSIERAALVEYLPEKTAAPSRSGSAVLGAMAQLQQQSEPLSEPAKDIAIVDILLPSGASLALKPRRDLPIVALYVLFPGGRCCETGINAGITNLMLRASLKGTLNSTAEQIANRIEALGSSIGLSLSPDYFGYSMKILSERFPEGVDILRDVLKSPMFLAEQVEKEKAAVLADIRRQRDSMSARASELFYRACFGDTPYGLSSTGTPETVAHITPEDLVCWHSQLTVAESAVVSVAGDITASELRRLTAELASAGMRTVPSIRSEFQDSVGVTESGDRKQTAALIGFEGVPIGHPDRPVYDLSAEINSGMAGRLFKAVRGENALAYAVSCFHRSRRDAGVFGVYTATSPENEERAREIIWAELDRQTREPVKEDELKRAKSSIRGSYAIGMQTFASQAGELAANKLFGLPVDESVRYLEQMEAVSSLQVQAVTARLVDRKRCWLGAVRGAIDG